MRSLILTSARLLAEEERAPGLVARHLVPWMVLLGLEGHEMRPAPYIRVHSSYGPMVDVAATRWRGPRCEQIEICYPVCRKGNPGQALFTVRPSDGDRVPVYGWAVPPVLPSPEAVGIMLGLAEGYEVAAFESLRAGPPVGPGAGQKQG